MLDGEGAEQTEWVSDMTVNTLVGFHSAVSDWVSRIAVVRRMARAGGVVVAAGLLVGSATSMVPLGQAPPASASGVTATVIGLYRERIPELMAEQGIPGLAVALVNRNRALWVQGFGYRDHFGGAPVTANTIFSVQSMSKTFTATAVMQAVAEGRLDIDKPITTYLPEFTVHSAFEKQPERKITLRMLLSHTAGFTHEAPIGNNNDLQPGDFDAHVRSISDTWLRFPVGTGYAYSNLGIDLAGYILERVEHRPFADLMHDSLLAPLGMDHSTFSRTVIRSTSDRAVGHVRPYPAPPVDVPMTAAGGLYTSAADLARFLRFQLNDGTIGGTRVLDPARIREMRTVVAPRVGAPAGYGLGVVRHRWNRWDQRPDLFEHGGGSFGFLSDMWWLPQLQVGVAILTNSQDHHLQGDLALSILADLVSEPGVYRDRLLRLPTRPPVDDPDLSFEPPVGMPNLVAKAAMAPTGDEATRLAHDVGYYRTPAWGVLDPTGPPDRFFIDGGVPYFEVDEAHSLVRHRLVEVAPDIFLADNGETLDLRGPDPTWQSIRIVRVEGGPAAWQWGILATAALIAASWLVAAAVRERRRRRSRPAANQGASASRAWRQITALGAFTIALLTLGNAVMVASLPGLVDSGFLGWLHLPVAVRLATHMPLALAVLGGCTVVLVGAGWVLRWWRSAVGIQYAVMVVAAAAVLAQLQGWHLIGWGYT
jgi:CubicO group peptidase (beta-lactamase class C family)